MAVKFSYEANTGAEFDQAYGRITLLEGSVQRITATMHIYATEDARNTGKQAVAMDQVVFTPDLADGASNLFSQAYAEFKRSGKLTHAVDA